MPRCVTWVWFNWGLAEPTFTGLMQSVEMEILNYEIFTKIIDINIKQMFILFIDTASERSYSRSLSPPENGFKNAESRLYSSQGMGPTRAERSPRTNRRVAHAPRSRSQPRIPVSNSSSQLTPKIDFSNGYDTDSSQGSRAQSNGASRLRNNRAWKPMREVLNVDSIVNSDNNERPLSNPIVQAVRQKRAPYTRELSASADVKPKSLMTIYEDEQRHELGSKSSLESESREKERTKGPGHMFPVKSENWRFQRIESGYESSDRLSDRLSNGSTSLDSPVVEKSCSKNLARIPEVLQLR